MKKQILKLIFLLMLITLILSVFFGCNMKEIDAKDKINFDNFNSFHYTLSKTTNPPEFLRYRFYKEDENLFFYYEKRDGNDVFLTEDDITETFTKKLTKEETARFFSFIENGKISSRQSKNDTTTGQTSPFLYIYYDGDKGDMQVFEFDDYTVLLEFEEFCESLLI